METRFLIVDGNSLACRAAYAHNPKFGPDLMTKDGLLTGPVYRFFSMFDNILKITSPTHIVVCWDVDRNTWRKQLYPLYKENRGSGGTNEELYEQFDIIKKLLNKLNIKSVAIKGYEGDDLVGTFCKLSKANKTFVISGDKDSFQLADEKTTILFPKNGFKEVELVTPDFILNKYNITVDKFIDLKALMGDDGDNIPGINGCGEKTATKLLQHFGSAKEVALTNGEFELKGINKTVKENIKEWKKDSEMILKLVTILKDVNVPYTFNDCQVEYINWYNVVDDFIELQFKSLVPKIYGGVLFNGV